MPAAPDSDLTPKVLHDLVTVVHRLRDEAGMTDPKQIIAALKAHREKTRAKIPSLAAQKANTGNLTPE